MRTFAQKPKATQQTTSAKSTMPRRAHFGQSREAGSILHLQRTIGNQAVQRLLQANAEERNTASATTASTRFAHDFTQLTIHPRAPTTIQPRLTVSTPRDRYEREADRVADQVMRMPEPQLQRTCACGGGCPRCTNEGEDNKELQVQRLQASGRSEVEVPPSVHEVLRPPGKPLEARVREFMETRFGHDFGRVRVHTDAPAAESAKSISARAYTLGRDIVFGKVQYSPATATGRHLLAHELTHVVQKSHQTTFKGIQREPEKKVDDDQATSAELAWEIFKPVVMGGVRSLAPGVLKSTQVGQNYKEVIDIVVKLEDSTKKLADYENKIKEITKTKAGGGHKFALKSLGKVNKHFQSIPDALEIDSEKLISEASDIVTSDMFTNMSDAVARLQNYAAIVNETKRLRRPYRLMVGRLTDAEASGKASFDALGELEEALLEAAKYAVLPVFMAELFSLSQTVHSYRSDAGTIVSTVRSKRKGYEQAIAASQAMEAYMSGKAGRKGIAQSYREPKDAACLKRVKAALPGLKKSTEAIYEQVLPYSECTFEHILDALDFLPIEETDGFFAVTDGLRDAYPDREGAIETKEDRYEAGLKLYAKLAEVRPALEKIDAKLDPMIMPFIYQEYYRFWVDDSRSLLSNYKFTYTHQIKQMTRNAGLLVTAVLSFGYFEAR